MMMRAARSRRWPHRLYVLVLCTTMFATSGCATAWKQTGAFYRTTQTTAHIESTPDGDVKVDSRYVGETPVDLPLQYKQEVIRRERKVSYWVTQPGLSLFITILSIGIYLPFSIIPVDPQTTLDPQDNFQGNEFLLNVSAPGYAEWSQVLRLSGEQKMIVRAELQKNEAAE